MCGTCQHHPTFIVGSRPSFSPLLSHYSLLLCLYTQPDGSWKYTYGIFSVTPPPLSPAIISNLAAALFAFFPAAVLLHTARWQLELQA
jgi:hypothetical protein